MQESPRCFGATARNLQSKMAAGRVHADLEPDAIEPPIAGAFRVTQEALQNIARHAARARLGQPRARRQRRTVDCGRWQRLDTERAHLGAASACRAFASACVWLTAAWSSTAPGRGTTVWVSVWPQFEGRALSKVVWRSPGTGPSRSQPLLEAELPQDKLCRFPRRQAPSAPSAP
jgi:hypothetical protein